MRHILFASVVVLLASCASEPIRQANSDLIRPYEFSQEKEHGTKPPYVAHFERAGKNLYYLVAEHGSEATFNTIRRVFAEKRPECVIVEGINTGDEISPKSVLPKVEECIAKGFQSCGESIFAIDQARRRGSVYISGEPLDQEIATQLASLGTPTNDLLGFYVVRQVPQWNRQNDPTKIDYEKEIRDILRRYESRVASSPVFDSKQFRQWYTKNVGSWKDLAKTSNNDVAPHTGSDATFLQKISAKVSTVRNKTILLRIEKMLASYDSVLVVYGHSHYLSHKPALVAMMGEAPLFNLEHWPAPQISWRPPKENPAMRR